METTDHNPATGVRRARCSCGTTVYLQLDSEPAPIGVPVGAFADPEFPDPPASIHESHRHHWVMLPDDIGHLP